MYGIGKYIALIGLFRNLKNAIFWKHIPDLYFSKKLQLFTQQD